MATKTSPLTKVSWSGSISKKKKAISVALSTAQTSKSSNTGLKIGNSIALATVGTSAPCSPKNYASAAAALSFSVGEAVLGQATHSASGASSASKKREPSSGASKTSKASSPWNEPSTLWSNSCSPSANSSPFLSSVGTSSSTKMSNVAWRIQTSACSVRLASCGAV